MSIRFEEDQQLGSWWNPFDDGSDDIDYNPEEQLTPNFKLKEFLVTSTPADNHPKSYHINNLRDLAKRFDAYLRPFTGAIRILSGYRSPEVNKYLAKTNVSVSNTSLHMDGKAGDVIFQKKSPQEVFVYLAQNPEIAKQFGEIAVKQNAMHITSPAPERNKVAAFMDAYGVPYLRLNKQQVNNLIKKWGTPTVLAAGAGGILIVLGLLGAGGFLIYKYRIKHGR